MLINFITWSRQHNSFFEMDKLQPLDFSRKREKDPTKKGKSHPLMRLPLYLMTEQ